jgi:hypothetical protein
MDRGYLDYALYQKWTQSGVYFVTRPRTNMLYEVVERGSVGTRGNVTCDETHYCPDVEQFESRN